MEQYKKNRRIVVLSVLGVVMLSVVSTAVIIFFMIDQLTPIERAKVILLKAPLIDGKNDFAYNIRKFAQSDLRKFNFSTNMTSVYPWKRQNTSQTDLLRLKEGKVGTQIWAARADCDSQYKDAVAITLEQIDLIKRLITNYSSTLMLVNISKDIDEAQENEKIGSLISIEGGHSIQSSLGILRQYYALGARMMTLAKGCSTPWIDCSKVDHPNPKSSMRTYGYNFGITKFGEDVVAEMNRLGMIIDVSYTSKKAVEAVLEKSRAPVVFSHSAAHSICHNDDNIRDDILKLVRRKDGLVMVTFDSETVTCNASNATLKHVVEQIEYIKSKASVDNIGIGSNFDGMKKPVKGLEDVSTFPHLFAALIEAGWDYGDLEKLAGKNFMRVFKRVEKVRDNLKNMDPLQAYVDRKHVKDNWDKVNCTSKMGLFPITDFQSNFSLPKDILSIYG